MNRQSIAAIALFLFAASLSAQAPAKSGAAMCKDGTTSEVTGRGACSRHGGVDKKATKAADRAAKAGPITDKPRTATPTPVPSSASAPMPAPASTSPATCKDGTTSEVTGRGACSRHGGVDKKATKAADRAAKAGPITYKPRPATPTPVPPQSPAPMPAPASAPRATPQTSAPRTTANAPVGASAQCKDGTYSMSKTRRGTCSHHGGVSTWMGLAK